jgi:hypothetical protein
MDYVFFNENMQKFVKRLWQNDKKCTIIKNCDKKVFFRFRLALERINYLL